MHLVGLADASRRPRRSIPSRVFDLLVGDGTGRALDRSILDAVLQESQTCGRRISHDDNARSSTSTSNRSATSSSGSTRASKEERLEGWRPTLAQPDMPRPANELPQDVPDHMKLMLDLIVLAFQMDKTRVATLMLNNDLSQMNFRFLEGVQGACTSTSRTTAAPPTRRRCT